jgi:hypothetical protein
MKTKLCAGMAYMTIAVASLIVGSTQVIAANYRFQVVDRSSSTTAIELIDEETGKPVVGAELFAVRTIYNSYKASPPTFTVRTPLARDSRGAFLVNARGSTKLEAHVPGEPQTIRGSVDLDH